MLMQTLLPAVLMAVGASAHTIFQQIGVNGVMEERYNYMRLPHYDGPIEDVTSSAVACNGGPNPLLKISPNVKTVAAGSTITMQWSHTLDSDLNNGLVIDASHKGPVMAYLAKVPDATGAIPKDGWFKIYEDGYSGGVWAVDKLITNKGKVTVTIPSCIPPGDYLFRGELIALHAAGNYPGAQLYMECAQIRVTGGGSASPATVSFPGAYAGTDPGIKFNLYTPNISYTIPGPRPFSCAGGSNPNPTTSQPTQPSTTSTTVRPTTTSTTVRPTTTSTTAAPTATGGAAQWAQCGGIGHAGPTTCATGTCVKLNDYYSQCQ